MQKVLFSLPLVGVMLTACSASSPAPVVYAEGGTLNPRAIQPVNGAVPYAGWQTDATSMSAPPPAYTVPQMEAPVPQPMIHHPAPTPLPPPPPAAMPKPAVMPKPVTTADSQSFTIPRDAKNAPIYSQIHKGFYNGETYTVRKGDTLFLIAYIAGKDVKEIATLNAMSEPYQLHIGQVIRIRPAVPAPTAPAAPAASSVASKPEVTYTQAPHGTAFGSDGTVTGPVKASVSHTPPRPAATRGGQVVHTPASTKPVALAPIAWQWPTQGSVIAGFSNIDGGNKGLDIAGKKGQPVKAAADGKVVYAGNVFAGYGNLIIITHNDDFISAYAHNDTIKVKEQERVRAGQTIATLGNTGAHRDQLHFEIRYQGKPVDPLRFLPKK